MHHLSRLLFIVVVFAVAYCLAMAVSMYLPQSILLVVIIALVALKRGRGAALTTLGSARWANWKDLKCARMLDSHGLILGHLCGGRSKWDRLKGAVLALFRWRVSSQTACRELRDLFKQRQSPLVSLPHAVHTAVFAPSGSGKGVSFVIPFLLTCPESCVVVDFKGENAKLTAEHRKNVFGHRVVIFDPYKQVSEAPDTFNPLSFIDKNHSEAIDDCSDLANALVVRTGEEKDPHFNDSAEMWIAALIAVVVVYGEGNDSTRSLQTVREILSSPEKLDIAIKLLTESTLCGGMLARMGGQLRHFIDKEKSSTLTTVSRHLRFLDTLAVGDCTRVSSFDPALLCKGKMTIYIILPPNHSRVQSPLLRMLITSLLRSVVKGGLQEQNKVHFVLDEASSLGALDAIDDAIDKYRGYGVRLQLYYQSLGQLKKCFPNGADQTLLSNTSQIFFAVNDQAMAGGTGTADYVSARLGEETLIVQSGSTSTGRSSQRTSGQSESISSSSNSTSSWQQQARKLLKPEEVVALSPRTAITFTPGVRPICTSVVRYYEKNWLGTEAVGRPLSALVTLVVAAIFCFMFVNLAMQATQRAKERRQPATYSPRDFRYSEPDVPVQTHPDRRSHHVRSRE